MSILQIYFTLFGTVFRFLCISLKKYKLLVGAYKECWVMLLNFIDAGKPVVFDGAIISVPAKILNLTTFCKYGH